MNKGLLTEIPKYCVVNMREGRGYPRCMEEILAKLREVVESIENPYHRKAGFRGYEGFELARQAVKDAIGKGGKDARE